MTDVTWDETYMWFRNLDSYSLFNASVTMRKNHTTGIMVIHPLPVGGHKVVFMTEFGLKIFDMEFNDTGDLKLHYCMPALNRKPVIKVLGSDIGMITGNGITDRFLSALYDRQTGDVIYRFRSKRKRYFHIVGSETRKVSSVIRTSSTFRKVRADFYGKGGNLPDSILLEHDHMNLIIKLTHINETRSTSHE